MRKIIKYKTLHWDGNGNILELKVLGYMKLKDPKSKLIQYPDKIRIVTEPLPGFSGATTFTIENKEVQVSRIYNNTLNKLLNSSTNEFTDTNRKKWIKVNNFDFDTNIIYTEINTEIK